MPVTSQQVAQNHPAQRKRRGRKPAPSLSTTGLVSLIVPSLGVVFSLATGSAFPLLVYSGFSAVSFLAYGYDKYRATRSGWRIREALLHTLDMLGGWPGGMFAQRRFSHKTRKGSFLILFWATVILHQVIWLRWLIL